MHTVSLHMEDRGNALHEFQASTKIHYPSGISSLPHPFVRSPLVATASNKALAWAASVSLCSTPTTMQAKILRLSKPWARDSRICLGSTPTTMQNNSFCDLKMGY